MVREKLGTCGGLAIYLHGVGDMLDYNVHLVQRYNNDFYQIQDHQSKLLDESAPLTLAGKDMYSQALPFLSYLITNFSTSCPSSALRPSQNQGRLAGTMRILS
jgi:hypothetical protein